MPNVHGSSVRFCGLVCNFATLTSIAFLPFLLPSQSYIFFILHRGELISLGDIENIHKKRKHDKESRLETVIVSSDYNVVMLSFHDVMINRFS